ncbi:hypothetical protein EI555_001476 [Monodon monoceros]|uniref:Piezo TM1-24 domain-containing protein n=1 Tax=Monodon monoceros TaxID=40151 RepID=A0A4V5P6L0_MONMO|nr:hypothetical protein EI555_001476 [Monodon monoceros]
MVTHEMRALCGTPNHTGQSVVLVRGPAPLNGMVFSFEDDEQDIQVDGEAQEKKEEEEAKEEKQERKQEEEEEDEQDIMKVLGNLVVALFIKYWIYVCGGMFFFVSFEGKIVMYKIIYMVLFLFCVALYQVHYEWWRRILKYFWMSVVIYTMLVLIFIYTYQFENFPGLWQNMTGLKKEK